MQTDDKLIPLARMALRVNMTAVALRYQIHQGKLHATRVAGRYMVRLSEIERYRREYLDIETDIPEGVPRFVQDEDTLLALSRAAIRLGLSYDTIYRRVCQGALHTVIVNHRYMVRLSEIERYRREVQGEPYNSLPISAAIPDGTHELEPESPATLLSVVRALALALPGATEGMMYRAPAFKVRGIVFARLRGGETLVVKIDRDTRAALIRAHPDTYFVTKDHRDIPSVLVRLSQIDHGDLQNLLTNAWRLCASQRQIAAHESRLSNVVIMRRRDAPADEGPDRQ